MVRESTLLGCYLNIAVSSWGIQNDVDTETTAVPDLRRQWTETVRVHVVSEGGCATSGEVKSPVHVSCKCVGWSVTVERKNQ